MTDTTTDAGQRVLALTLELNKHLHAYHVLDNPTIPDAVYDQLFSELQALEALHPELQAPDSPTLRVGAAPLPQFDQVTHTVPMLSLNNGFSEDDIVNFDRRVREGLGISLLAGTVPAPAAGKPSKTDKAAEKAEKADKAAAAEE